MNLPLTFLCMYLNLDVYVSLILPLIFIILTFTYPFMYKHCSIAFMVLDQPYWTGISAVTHQPVRSSRQHIPRCTISHKHLSKGFNLYGTFLKIFIYLKTNRNYGGFLGMFSVYGYCTLGGECPCIVQSALD